MIVRVKLLAKDLLRGLGLELRRLRYVNSEETVLPAILAVSRPAAILDVGANTGQYAQLLRKCGYRGTIVSFEAIAAVHAHLCTVSKRDSDWLIAPQAALGAQPGEADIHIAGNSVSSSLLPMNAAHLAAAPESGYVGSQKVQVHRLDALAPQLLAGRKPLMLKIDTQGYELEVLKGSAGILQEVSAIQVETSLTPLYRGAPGFTELISYIEALGFEIFSLVPGLRNERDGRLLQMDAFFIRGPKSQE